MTKTENVVILFVLVFMIAVLVFGASRAFSPVLDAAERLEVIHDERCSRFC